MVIFLIYPGGGLGALSRQFGAASDQIIKATIVTAAGGAIVTASSTSNPDLLWALKVRILRGRHVQVGHVRALSSYNSLSFIHDPGSLVT